MTGRKAGREGEREEGEEKGGGGGGGEEEETSAVRVEVALSLALRLEW